MSKVKKVISYSVKKKTWKIESGEQVLLLTEGDLKKMCDVRMHAALKVADLNSEKLLTEGKIKIVKEKNPDLVIFDECHQAA